VRARRRRGLAEIACCGPYELCADQPELLAHYRRRFRHVLWDEFQDTNAIQLAWMRLLAPPRNRAMTPPPGRTAVRRRRRTTSRLPFRGARVENLQHFARITQAQLYRLEQTPQRAIWPAATALIAPIFRAAWQEPVDERRARRADPAVRGIQRAR